MNVQTCIIVGASHAGAQLATSLRQEKWEGRILVIGDEPTPPYHRPPLSKSFLSGDKRVDELLIRPHDTYEKHGIELLLGARVEALDLPSKTVTLDNGEVHHFDKLALCTGSRARQVNLPGAALAGVCYLRNVADVQRIRAQVRPGGRAVIIGAGYIGLETAALLRSLGMQVTVLEMMKRVLQRVTAPQVSAFYSRVHAEEGVSIKTGVSVEALLGSDKVEQVLAVDGSRYPADLVVIGVGIVPNVELAKAAGLHVEDGIVVDQFAVTSAPDVVAAGDCTSHPNAHYARRLRLESVPNACEQAKAAAASLCGKQQAYNSLPWFWSDQYDLKMQIAGLSQGYDQVAVRGRSEVGRDFALFYFKQGRLIAADCINRPQEFMVSKRLIAMNSAIQADVLTNESIEPKEWLKA